MHNRNRRNLNSADRWNDVPRRTMDEASPFRVLMPAISLMARTPLFSSGLTDDDWTKINRLRHLHESGGCKVSDGAVHRGSKDDCSVSAFAVKPRACGAPLCGFGA